MRIKRVISLLLVIVLLGTMAVFTSNAVTTDTSGTGAYFNQNKYSSQTYNGDDLGCTYTSSATTWKVWSPAAQSVQLKLYKTGTDRENGAGVIGTYDLSKDASFNSNGVWKITLQGDYKNVYYTYLVTAANTNGTVVTNETQDIYSKAVGCNGNRSMVVDLNSTNPEGWNDDKHVVFDNKTEAAVWELHVRDFSCDPNSGISEENQGKYLAFTEGGTKLKSDSSSQSVSTGIDYLVENNINCVELMPFADYDQVDEINGGSSNNRNWGYNPKNYNVPDGTYSSDPYDGNVRINEVKQMVQALHDRGISVIMDVVYNHTAGYEASCFTNTVPGYYYRMSSATQYVDGSGQGCELATENAMVRNYIVQSLSYWASEYHIDGFRFDLMACIDVTTLNEARKALNNLYTDGTGNKIMMFGEPWTGGTSAVTQGAFTSNAGSLLSGIGMFSADMIAAATNVTENKSSAAPAGWVGGQTTGTATVVKGIQANIIYSSDNTKTVTYAECHDDLALWDRITGAYTKSGQGKASETVAPNVDSTDSQYTNQLKLAGALFMTSQGYTYMQAGTEFARTKHGQANSYNSPDNINQLDWSRVVKYADTVNYYKGLRQIKDVYSPFSDDTVTSKNTMNFISSSGALIAYTIENRTSNSSKEWGKVAVLLNNSTSSTNVNLGSSGWVVVANNQSAGLKKLEDVSGSSYTVQGRSAAILVEASSYKDFSNDYNYGTLTTNHYVGSELKKTVTAKYRIGTKYHALKDADILKSNNLKSTDGTASGTFSGDTTVNYYYESNGKTVGTLKVDYVNQNGEKVTPSMSYSLENGNGYNIPVCSVEGYQLDTDKYPANTTGTFNGTDKTITFTYKPLDSQEIKVHYYKSNNWSMVFCYAYTDDGEEPLGEWNYNRSNTKSVMTSEGSNWYTIKIPIASCKVMFHGAQGQSQEPGQNEPGYPVAGECWIQNKVVTYNSTLVTSYIDVNTGKKLKDDVSVTEQKKSTDEYKTSPDESLGELVNTPANAEGFYQPGVTNIVYLYNTGSPKPSSSDSTSGTTKIVDSRILGDSNLDGTVDVNDVTYIQKYLVSLILFDNANSRNSDVDGNGKISIKDASYIQRYLAGISVSYDIGKVITETTPPTTAAPTAQPTTVRPTDPQPTTEPAPQYGTVIFSNSRHWEGQISCYYWDDSGTCGDWPGVNMQKIGTNDYGEDQYSIELPYGVNCVFTNGTLQTVDLVYNGETGFYAEETTDEQGHYNCGSW